MAIEKMKLLSITGKVENIDNIIINYLLQSGIQLENAIKVYEKSWNLKYFSYNADIKDKIKVCKDIMKTLGIEPTIVKVDSLMNYDDISSKLTEISNNINDKQKYVEEKENELQEIEVQVEPIEHLKNLDVNLRQLYDLEYMDFRYGKMSIVDYEDLVKAEKKDNFILYETDRDSENVWFLCFTSRDNSQRLDSFLNVMQFDRIWIPEEINSSALNFLESINQYKLETVNSLETIKKEFDGLGGKLKDDLNYYYSELLLLERANIVKKYMAYDEGNTFYIIGWVPIKKLNDLLPKLKKEKVEYVLREDDEVTSIPPTKLRNNRLIKPFEYLVKMYGVPNYGEIDPTLFVAITSFLMFGFMFGDVGQGLVLTIAGLIMSYRKSSIGPVVGAFGLSGMIFGFLYGSIFGQEDVIKGFVPNPMNNITTMMIIGIASGAILIILAMILNIRNGIRKKDIKKIFLDKNGLAGLIFYVSVLGVAIKYIINGNLKVSLGIIIATMILPLVIIMFKNSIEAVIKRKENKEHETFVEKIFEVVELLLSFTSNTISFVRLAAFAINHVGLCMAINILSTMFSGGGSLVVQIIGNIIVIVLEGLIVGIQVLRLEYYELFSRFYEGNGKEYTSIEEIN